MASPNRDEISRLELLHAAHPDGLVFPHLADAYRRAGRYDEADALLRVGLRRHPDYASAYLVLGRLRVDQRRPGEAESAFRRVLELDPPNQAASEHLDKLRGPGMQEVEADAGTGGSGSTTPAATTTPAGGAPDDVVTETMAELYARQGLFRSAASVYRALLERSPDDRRLKAKLDAVEQRQRATVEPPAIRDHLSSVAAWKPAAPSGSAEVPPDPPVSVRMVEPEKPRSASSSEQSGAHRPGTAPVTPEAAQVSETSAPAKPAQEAPAGARHEGVEVESARLVALADLLVGLLEHRQPFVPGKGGLARRAASLLASELGLPTDQRQRVALAALLRDLGRFAGPEASASGTSGPQESGASTSSLLDVTLSLLDGAGLPDEVREAIRLHQERWDGQGRPHGLVGEEIPLGARILAVVDAFVSRVSPAAGPAPLGAVEAAAALQPEAGRRYDPRVVDALRSVVARPSAPRLDFTARHRIVIVAAEPAAAAATAARLRAAGYLTDAAANEAGVRRRLGAAPAAGLLVSAAAGGRAAASLVRGLRRDGTLAELPIIVVDAASVALRVELLEDGADVCFPPGVSHAEIQGTLAALVRRVVGSQTGRIG